jgi:hypothetical protein
MHRAIGAFAEEHGVQTPAVEVELADSTRFTLQRIDPEPGYGMVTLHVRTDDSDAPDALIVPLGSIRRIELRKTPEERVRSTG